MPRKQCQECKEIKNMSELSAKLKLCQSCRTCEECGEVVNKNKVYYAKVTPYNWESRSGEYMKIYCPNCWKNEPKRNENGAYVKRSYDFEELLEEYNNPTPLSEQKRCIMCQELKHKKHFEGRSHHEKFCEDCWRNNSNDVLYQVESRHLQNELRNLK